jgi:hypothetical protein
MGRLNVVAQTYFMVELPCAELADKMNLVIWTEGQGKTKRGRSIEDESNEQISKIEIEREECSIRVLNRGGEGRE